MYYLERVKNNMNEREVNVYKVRLAEQSERFDEMSKFMSNIATEFGVLTPDERNLLSVAYKNLIGTRRASWRVLYSIEQKEISRNNNHRAIVARDYRESIEKELRDICMDVINLSDSYLIPNSLNDEDRVFYNKMAGDYYRYLAEFSNDKDLEEFSNYAKSCYERAKKFAINLPSTHPFKLGLALNYSVFYYEILKQTNMACQIAKEAFDEAMLQLDSLSDNYKDSSLIMQLLKDNLNLWSPDNNDESLVINDKKSKF